FRLRQSPQITAINADPRATGREPGPAAPQSESSVAPRAAAAATTAAAILARTRLVDLDRAAADFLAVEGADGVVGAVLHLDKAEAARLAGLAVGDQPDAADRAVLPEQVADLLLRRAEGQVSHVPLLHGSVPFRSPRVKSTPELAFRPR